MSLRTSRFKKAGWEFARVHRFWLRRIAIGIILAAALSSAACHYTTALTCPPGDTLMGAPPPKGEEVWCQKIVNGKPVKDGLFIVYGEGSDKLIQGSYREGAQDGEWTTWYASGQRSAVDHFDDGLQNGLHTSWYFNGVKSIEGEYRMGKREGVWTRWDSTGYTSKQDTYRDDRLVD